MGELKLIARLALRNVRRYARRSALTLITIVVGIVMLLFTVGISEGSYRRAIDTAARSGSGHVVVRAADYDPIQPRSITDSEAVLAAANAIEGARGLPRVRIPSLAQSTGGSATVLLIGLDPDLEKGTSILPEAVKQGEWVANTRGPVPRAAIGRVLARRLDLEVDDRLVLTINANDDLESALVRVGGIFATGSDEIDAGLVVVPLDAARDLIGDPGATHEVAVVLDNLLDADAVRDQLQAVLPTTDLVQTWAEALPDLGDFIAMDRAGGDAMFVILFALVSLAVLNSVLMSVMERVHEFGLLLAVGSRPSTLFGVVLLEALILSGVAALAGVVVGGGIVVYYNQVGLDLGALMGTSSTIDVGGYDITGVMYPYLPIRRTLLDVGAVIGITVLVTLYPAWKAARVEPVEAISHD